LLTKHRSLRRTITNRVRNAIFAVFGEDQLSHIDTVNPVSYFKFIIIYFIIYY